MGQVDLLVRVQKEVIVPSLVERLQHVQEPVDVKVLLTHPLFLHHPAVVVTDKLVEPVEVRPELRVFRNPADIGVHRAGKGDLLGAFRQLVLPLPERQDQRLDALPLFHVELPVLAVEGIEGERAVLLIRYVDPVLPAGALMDKPAQPLVAVSRVHQQDVRALLVIVAHEMVGVVEKVGADVTSVKPGDRVTVNVETFCGECFFCRRGYVNNCTDPNGGWALGCRIDGGQAEYVRVPYADQGLNRIPDTVSDEQALFVGDVLATGFWATRISEISEDDTVLIIGAGPTGICTLLCVMLKKPRRIIVCEKSPERIRFVREHYPDVLVVEPENCKEFVIQNSEHGGADVVLEVAGSKDTFRLAWECARPNAVVTIVALYDEPQILPLPDMYGKNLIFKTGGVDGCDCAEILNLIEEGKIDTTPLITHRFPLNEIEEAYRIFENKLDGVIKVAIYQ